MVYIELNMVRADVVGHPEQWPRCSYQEWMGRRRRYVLTNQQACLGTLGNPDLKTFQENYLRLIDETISQDKPSRDSLSDRREDLRDHGERDDSRSRQK